MTDHAKAFKTELERTLHGKPAFDHLSPWDENTRIVRMPSGALVKPKNFAHDSRLYMVSGAKTVGLQRGTNDVYWFYRSGPRG